MGKKEKLSPRYIVSYQTVRTIGNMAYELEFSPELAVIHPIFHISMLKKCLGDISLLVPIDSIGLRIACLTKRF